MHSRSLHRALMKRRKEYVQEPGRIVSGDNFARELCITSVQDSCGSCKTVVQACEAHLVSSAAAASSRPNSSAYSRASCARASALSLAFSAADSAASASFLCLFSFASSSSAQNQQKEREFTAKALEAAEYHARASSPWKTRSPVSRLSSFEDQATDILD